jgi:hypothetical protein
MKVNRGGLLAPDQVVGRNEFIDELWHSLVGAGVVLTAERRVGKTSVVRRMHAEPRASFTTFYQDLERVHRPIEFVEAVLGSVRSHLSTQRRTLERLGEFLSALGGTEVAGVLTLPDVAAPQWKTLLLRVMADLMQHQEGHVVFFWDEYPQMLHNIAATAPEEAMEVMDVLRSLRQEHPRLRMVLTGSIGLHTVIHALQQKGYRNAPNNDLQQFSLPPLSDEDAAGLAAALLAGEKIVAADAGLVATEVAATVGNIPFYIHQVVGAMRGRAGVGPGTANQIVDEGLNNPQDPWELRHYRTRLEHDYSAEDRPYALATLDALAVAQTPLSFRDLSSRAMARPGVTDDERLRTVLKLLQQDHYVVRSPDREYRFATPLIARWWRMDRDL